MWTQSEDADPPHGGGLMIANADGTHVRSLYPEGGTLEQSARVIGGSNQGTTCAYAGPAARVPWLYLFLLVAALAWRARRAFGIALLGLSCASCTPAAPRRIDPPAPVDQTVTVAVVDGKRLTALGLAMRDVTAALAAEGLHPDPRPGKRGGEDVTEIALGAGMTPERLATVILGTRNGAPTRLNDVAILERRRR